MAANLPVAFAALLAGGLLLEKGLTATKGAFASTPAAGAAAAPGAAPGSGSSAPPAKGGTYTFDQLKQLWTANGGNPASAAIAAAVALAESAGDPHNRLLTGAEDSRGLWQINLFAHPDYNSTDLYDANANAKAAIAVSNNGANWGPWSTFTDGKYRQFLH